MADHVDHAVEVAGVEHVCLGGDFLAQIASVMPELDPHRDAIRGLASPADYPALLDHLARRGHDAAAIERISFGNLRRVLGRALAGS